VALRSGIECFTSLRYAKHSTPDPDLSSNILKPKTWKPKHSEKAIFRHPTSKATTSVTLAHLF
jgi:hypothetical protein